MTRTLAGLVVIVLAALAPARASALITGGEGNDALADPGWPKGAAAIFNHPGRVAWWVGPPFGGGQWHAECRGDAKALEAVLDRFAKLDVKTKRVVVHDGVGHSFWLAPNAEPAKLKGAEVDWVFMVWQPEAWKQLDEMPARFKPADAGEDEPSSQIDAFTGNIRWRDVVVPPGIDVVDQRLEAHGFTAADGVVIEGRATDVATRQPIAATMRLERIEPQKSGYLYTAAGESKADAEGRWVLKNVPAGLFRLIVESDGYVPRIAAHDRFDEQPQWKSYNTGLAPSATVSGRVVDESGKPLADVDVRLDNVEPQSGGSYESPQEYKFKTDAEGHFRADRVPAGKATISVHKSGYCRPGPSPVVTAPKEEVKLRMVRSGSIRVTVEFAGKRPQQYMVTLDPKEGNVIGSYGGGGNIDEKNQFTYENVPPGEYLLSGRANPGRVDQTAGPIAIDVKGGEAAERTLKAK
ncbi:MAG TPA: carboxypeptidase-like regulatory domain-containing protein [Pirellulales bacterium]|jgi:hypothetical protein|nr:carboxypeptidase-like regulatory domain-containing protein [Pirellulales bacterium]